MIESIIITDFYVKPIKENASTHAHCHYLLLPVWSKFMAASTYNHFQRTFYFNIKSTFRSANHLKANVTFKVFKNDDD